MGSRGLWDIPRRWTPIASFGEKIGQQFVHRIDRRCDTGQSREGREEGVHTLAEHNETQNQKDPPTGVA